MNKRYAVTDGDRTFAFVHATNAADAICIACEKVQGHDPSGCTATVIGDNDQRCPQLGESQESLLPD